MRISQLLAFGVCMSLMFFAIDSAVAGQDACNKADGDAKKNIDDAYMPKIDLWIKVSKALSDKGIDPRKYPVIMPDGTVEILDTVDVVEKLSLQRSNAYVQIDQAIGQCNKELEPYQKAIDLSVVFATGGLSAVLPPSMKHVDASQILSGRPLGGAGALIPKMRDDLLKGLGVGGTVGGMIKDPLCVLHNSCG